MRLGVYLALLLAILIYPSRAAVLTSCLAPSTGPMSYSDGKNYCVTGSYSSTGQIVYHYTLMSDDTQQFWITQTGTNPDGTAIYGYSNPDGTAVTTTTTTTAASPAATGAPSVLTSCVAPSTGPIADANGNNYCATGSYTSTGKIVYCYTLMTNTAVKFCITQTGTNSDGTPIYDYSDPDGTLVTTTTTMATILTSCVAPSTGPIADSAGNKYCATGSYTSTGQVVYCYTLMSDVSVKFCITKIGSNPDGSPIYDYCYPDGTLTTTTTSTTTTQTTMSTVPITTTMAAVTETTTGLPETTTGILETTTGILETTTGILETTTGILDTTTGVSDSTTVAAETTTGISETTTGVLETTTGLQAETTTGLLETTTGISDTSTGVPETTTILPVTTTGILETTTALLETTTGVSDTTTGLAETTTGVSETTTAVLVTTTITSAPITTTTTSAPITTTIPPPPPPPVFPG